MTLTPGDGISHGEPIKAFTELQYNENSLDYISKQTNVRDKYDSFSSSGVSSPFVTNPDILRDIGNRSTDTLHLNDGHTKGDEEFDISQNSQIENIDKSIASLKQSLTSIKKNNNPTHEVSMDTTRFDETQAQFDRDIDIDESDISSRLASSSGTKSIPQSSTPWRKLRSTNSQPINLPPAPKLQFGVTNVSSGSGTGSSNMDTINDLNRQLTGYKIQIRFFKQFLQKIIETRQIDNEYINELSQFQNNLPGLSPIKKVSSNNRDHQAEVSKMEMDYRELSKSYDEIYKLNEDLYSSLEQFQADLQKKESTINSFNSLTNSYNEMIDEIIQILMNDELNDNVSKEALKRCLDNSDNSIPLKLQVIKMEVHKRTEHQRRSSFSSSASTKFDKERELELNQYLKTINQLMTTLEQTQAEFTQQRALTSKVENDLQLEIERSKKLKSNYNLIKEKFTSLVQTADTNLNTSNDILKNENDRLNTVNSTIMKKFDVYKQIIDDLQKEVDDFKHLHVNSSQITSELNEELLQSHKDFNSLQEEYNELHDKYVKLKEDSSNTVSSLTNQLQSNKDINSSHKADKLVLDKLEQELKLATERERTLKAEKIRLTYKVESLTKDKISKQTTIENLADKITSLTVNEDADVSLNKKVNILEYQVKELLQIDLNKFEKLLDSFNKIADDSSLKEPKRKIDYMAHKLIPRDEIDLTNMSTIRDYHKSVFDYFTRAVEVVVNDHVKLLLTDNEDNIKSAEYVNKLHKRIDELNHMNDELSRSTETDTNDYDSSFASPRSKLRIEELTNRWKAEREARVYENNEANRRLKELEMENDRLRDEITG